MTPHRFYAWMISAIPTSITLAVGWAPWGDELLFYMVVAPTCLAYLILSLPLAIHLRLRWQKGPRDQRPCPRRPGRFAQAIVGLFGMPPLIVGLFSSSSFLVIELASMVPWAICLTWIGASVLATALVRYDHMHPRTTMLRQPTGSE